MSQVCVCVTYSLSHAQILKIWENQGSIYLIQCSSLFRNKRPSLSLSLSSLADNFAGNVDDAKPRWGALLQKRRMKRDESVAVPTPILDNPPTSPPPPPLDDSFAPPLELFRPTGRSTFSFFR